MPEGLLMYGAEAVSSRSDRGRGDAWVSGWLSVGLWDRFQKLLHNGETFLFRKKFL